MNLLMKGGGGGGGARAPSAPPLDPPLGNPVMVGHHLRFVCAVSLVPRPFVGANR